MFGKPTTFVVTLFIIIALFDLNKNCNVIALTTDPNSEPLTVGVFNHFVESFVTVLQNQCCAAESVSCPVPKLPVITLETSTYYFATGFMSNWFDAHQFCELHGMKLAALETEKENEVVTEHARKLGQLNAYWLSGSDEDSEGSFYWSLTGKSIDIENWSTTPWGPTEPNNIVGGENCLALWTGNFMWNDEKCTKMNNFICEL